MQRNLFLILLALTTPTLNTILPRQLENGSSELHNLETLVLKGSMLNNPDHKHTTVDLHTHIAKESFHKSKNMQAVDHFYNDSRLNKTEVKHGNDVIEHIEGIEDHGN